MAQDNLPPYVSNEQPPGYSSTPLANETTMAHTPRPGFRNQDGHYTRLWKQATLILHDQDENATRPSYSRGGTVNGELGLVFPEHIVEISAKV